VSAFGYRKPADLPQTIPLFPLTGAILMPRGVLALNVFEPRYLNMVDDALSGDRLIGMIQPASGDEDNPAPDLSDVGTVGRITAFSETDDGRYFITLTGICRFDLNQELEAGTPYRQALVSFDAFGSDFTQARGERIDRDSLIKSLKSYASLHGFVVNWDSVEQAPTETIVNVAAQICPFDPAAKQAMLEALTLEDRTQALLALLEWRAPPPSRAPRRQRSAAHAMTEVDPKLLEVLVCPQTRTPLRYDRERQELISERARLAYPVRDGVPIMLIDEARELGADE
jgi:Lon protease-like protein/uncharacterized protein YbaR (Trm112 family)